MLGLDRPVVVPRYFRAVLRDRWERHGSLVSLPLPKVGWITTCRSAANAKVAFKRIPAARSRGRKPAASRALDHLQADGAGVRLLQRLVSRPTARYPDL